MYKFIQKNQKKFLAIFAVGLMIVFILPQVAFDQNRGTAREVIAHAGDEPIHLGEVRVAQDQWRDIANFFPTTTAGLVGIVAEDIQNDPALFVLLQREARQMGIRVSPAQVDEALTEMGREYAMRGMRAPDLASLRPAMHSLLMVRSLFERIADGIKLSSPVILREMAENGQRVKIDLVHYSAEEFAKNVPAPTAEQMQKQFDQFRNTAPGNPTEQNPFGFGYLMPAEVRLLYLTVPREEVARAVRASKEQIDWETAAVIHYRRNLSKYVATQPAETQPATQSAETQPATAETTPATAPTTGPATTQAARPTTRPFGEVKEQVIQEVMQPEIERRMEEISTWVVDRMTADFEARSKSAGTPQDFGTRQYLERIAADVEKRHGVKLGVSEINDPKTEQQLAELKGIGDSFAGETPFAQFIMRRAGPFVPAGQRSGVDVLSLDEPSRPLRDFEGNAYIVQVRDATPARPPQDMQAVKDKLESDIRKRLALEAATEEARKLHQAAAGGSRLADAAKPAGKEVFTTDFFDREGRGSSFEPVNMIPDVPLPDASQQKLVRESFELLAKASPDKPHPPRIVELPAAGRAAVIELGDVERPWTDELQPIFERQVGQRLAMQRAERVLREHFAPEAVKRRLNFRYRREQATETASVQ